MALCRVTGTVYLPNGSLAVNRQIVFRREKKDITAEYLGALFPDDVWQFTNAQGQIDVTLLTGRYVAFAQAPQRAYFGIVTVPDAPTANFADIIGDFEIPETPPVWYNQALQARDDAVAATDEADALVSPYASVAEATAAVKPASVDRVLAKTSWGTVAFLRKAGGPCLGGGWIPDGDVYPDHFLDNASMGITDMLPAFNSALSYASSVKLRGAYAVSGTIRIDNRSISGTHSLTWPTNSRITGLSSFIPEGEAILRLGRTSTLENVTIGYDALTGGEGENDRVALDVRGDLYGLQRASWVNGVRFENVGTAVSDFGNRSNPSPTLFSVSFGSNEVFNFSYAAIDLGSTTRTGSDWGNWYIANSSSSLFTPSYGVRFGGRSVGGSFMQLNIEHAAFTVCPISLEGARGLSIDNLHIEGTDNLTEGTACLSCSNSSVEIKNFTILHTRCSADQLSLIWIGGGRFDDSGTVYVAQSQYGYVGIGTLLAKGLANPDGATYPSYPSNRRGLVNVPGWVWFRRDPAENNNNYEVNVSHYDYAVYPATPSDGPIYSNLTNSGSLLVTQIGPRSDETSTFAPFSTSMTLYRPNGFFTIGALTSDASINIPSGARNGQTLILYLVQDSVGNRQVTISAIGTTVTGQITSGPSNRRGIARYKFTSNGYVLESFSGWLS